MRCHPLSFLLLALLALGACSVNDVPSNGDGGGDGSANTDGSVNPDGGKRICVFDQNHFDDGCVFGQ